MQWFWKTSRILKAKGNFFTRGVYLTLILTHRCPLKCNYCPLFIDREKRPAHKESTLQEWKSFIENFPQFPSRINFSGGEPSLMTYMPELANWLTARGHHVCIYSMLFNQHRFIELKPNFKLQIQATYHDNDNPVRFKFAYDFIKKVNPELRINPKEIKEPKVFSFTAMEEFFSPEHIKNFNSFHASPSSPRTGKLYIGCEPCYSEVIK
jgi:organic radical activating enzyme